MKPNTDIRRAADALQRAIEVGPDDFDHPAHAELVALVDGRLEGVDREVVETHVELCATCAQDVGDLAGVRDAIHQVGSAPARAGRSFPMQTLQIAAAILAVVGIALFARRQFATSNVATNSIVAGDLQVPGSVPGSTATTATATNTPIATAPVAPIDPLTADERAVVDRALATGKLEMPAAIRSLAGPVGTLLGAVRVAESLEPLTPIGTAVLSETPEFTWHAMAGVTSYSVAVFDDQFKEVAHSPALTTTHWTPSVALPRGATLAWQVTAHFPSRDVLAPEPPQPEARFVVVDKATADAIIAQQARLSSQPLALGVLLAKAGLFSDAAREFTRAAAQPDTADRAKALLASLSK